MSDLRFHFIDNARGEDGRLAAAILADCLSRQGLPSEADGSTVAVAKDARRASEPDEVYIVLDENHLARTELLEQLDSRTAIVVCSARPARILRHELGRFTGGLTAVDADGIAMNEGADPVVALLGAAARTCPSISPDALSASVWNYFDRQLPYAAHAAVRAFDLGYMQAQSAL